MAEICNAVTTSRLVPGSTLPLPQGLLTITQLIHLSLYSLHLPPAKSYCLWKLNAGFARTIILPVVLYGCESWSLTLREECGLRVFEKRMLRRIFGPKRNEVTEEQRKLHNKELNHLYSSPNIVRVIKSRRLRWAGHMSRMGERRIQGLVGKLEGKRPLGRPRSRWEDNIKMVLQEVGCAGMDWIELA